MLANCSRAVRRSSTIGLLGIVAFDEFVRQPVREQTHEACLWGAGGKFKILAAAAMTKLSRLLVWEIGEQQSFGGLL